MDGRPLDTGAGRLYLKLKGITYNMLVRLLHSIKWIIVDNICVGGRREEMFFWIGCHLSAAAAYSMWGAHLVVRGRCVALRLRESEWHAIKINNLLMLQITF